MATCRSCDAEIAIAWAAGFFDGEGSYSINRNKHRMRDLPNDWPHYHSIVMRATQVVRSPLDRLPAILGGYVSSVGPKGWCWTISGSIGVRAATLLLLPHFVVKREQAYLALQYCEGVGHLHRRNERLSDEVWNERDRLAGIMREINGRHSANVQVV